MSFMRAVRIAILTAMMLVLSGCTSGPAPHVVTSGQYAAVVDAPRSASGDAAITGYLVIDGAGCWSLSQKNGGDPQPVIWPAGTNPVGIKLRVPGIRSPLDVGTAIKGGGGAGSADKSYPPCMSKGDAATYISGISLAP
jgi:hypothetical protein